jgi:hypothetical protein
MKLVDFKGRNVIYAENQPEYQPLPALKLDDGRLICCWKLSWKDRLRVLLFGEVWHQVLTFNMPLQPQLLSIEKPFKLNKN